MPEREYNWQDVLNSLLFWVLIGTMLQIWVGTP